MYLRGIEHAKQKLEAFIKKRGFVENLGQPEYRDFLDKVNGCAELTHAQKADLADRFSRMVDSLEL